MSMFSERKPKFRSRKLDFGKQLPIYRYDEVDDLDDFDSPLRSVAQVATGVDKEEETEHHLRQALTHQSTKTQAYYIPTPDAAQAVADYDAVYPSSYKQSKNYGKSLTIEDPLQKFPKYNADELDKALLEKLKANNLDLTLYEWIIDCLEEAAQKFSENIVSSESVERLRDKFTLPEEAVINQIIDYWKSKRTQRHLIPRLKYEDLGKIGADPYVCFRRRELKIPRKTRRSDAQIVDRLKKLYLDLSTIKLMMEAAVKRDKYKREALVSEGDLFEKYRLIDAWRKHNKSEWPSNIPTFKTAAQSLLETKKKKNRPENEVPEETNAYKIAIPVAVLRSSKHARPYYPHEVGKAIQRDLDVLLGQGHDLHDNKVNMDDICPIEEQITGQVYSRFSSIFDGHPVSCRRGRGGRLVFDRPRPSSYSSSYSSSCSSSFTPFYNNNLNNDAVNIVQFHAKALSAKDFTQVQTPIGNYNVHAVQTANQILRPMSFQAWIASTASLVQTLSGANKLKTSPKKKRPRPDNANKPNASPSDASPQVEMSKLSSAGSTPNGQITVKVKTQPTKETRKGTGARFTPHGLAPENDVSVDVK